MKSNRENDLHLLQQYILGDDYKKQNKNQQISIADFYAYVFGNKADIKTLDFIAPKKSSKKPETATGNIINSATARKTLSTEEIQEIKYAEKQAQLNNFRDALGEKIINYHYFRYMLRQVKSSSLEIFLYGNNTDYLPQAQLNTQFSFYTDKEIKEKFIDLNNTYEIYDEKSLTNASEQFIPLYKGCKLIADFIEKNNDDDNSVPALHAYKILVLFNNLNSTGLYPFANFEHHLKQFDGYKQPNPIHDALVIDLPTHTKYKIKDLDGWQRLIKNYGSKAILIFQRADVIENELGKAPANLKQAEQISAKSSYKRYEEYPELADICIQYKVSEDIYNQCLEIRKNIKKRDNLPDYSFDVNGKSVSHAYAGYHLAKLPIDDPHAYILGHITHCCQSIGGDSEQCVIDGITLENNGFYVLLKNKTGTENHYRLPDNRINYKDYDIIGQGYTWIGKSDSHNLCFDSWENLHTGNGIESCVLVKLPDTFNSVNVMGDLSPDVKEKIFAIKNVLILFKEKFYYLNLNTNDLSLVSPNKTNIQKLNAIFSQINDDGWSITDEYSIVFVNRAMGNPQDDEITVALLKQFSKKYTDSNESLRVTIGRGGKTPSAFKTEMKLAHPEKMAEGFQYRDSKIQNLVYFNEKNYEYKSQQIKKYIKESSPDNIDIEHLIGIETIIFTENLLRAITLMLKDKNTTEILKYIFTPHNPNDQGTSYYEIYENRSKIYEEYMKDKCIWTTLLLLNDADDLNIESYKILEKCLRSNFTYFYNSNNSELLIIHNDFNNTLKIMINTSLYNHDIYKTLLESLKQAPSYHIAIQNVSQRKLLSIDNLNYIISLKEDAAIFKFKHLSNKHFDTLLNNRNDTIPKIRSVLQMLEDHADIKLNENIIDHVLNLKKLEYFEFFEKFQIYLNAENCTLILSKLSTSSSNNDELISVLQFLQEYGILMKNETILPTILSNTSDANFIKQIKTAIDDLPKLASELMYQQVVEFILLHPENTQIIVSSLVELSEKLKKNLEESTQSHPFGLYTSPNTKISKSAANNLLFYLCTGQEKFENNEINQIASEYGDICKKLIANNYPLPQELQKALTVSQKFGK